MYGRFQLGLLALLIAATVSPARSASSEQNSCDKCHPIESRSQPATPMAHAAARAIDAEILKAHPNLRATSGRYTYVIHRDAKRVTYSVTDGPKKFSAPILWAFGFGNMGQTYIYEYRGAFYETQVSYYSALNGLDLTIGHRNSPAGLEQAAGRPIQKLELIRCFACHTTGTLDNPAAGIRCERCHQNALQHARDFADKTLPPATPEKLSRLTLEEQSDFCGACHRTWQDISANGPHDINNVRFQPYRLATSKCYNSSAGDKRISCTACHDPHRIVDKTADAYDAKCQACHAAANPAAKTCPTAQHACVTCHMPKVDFPGGHFQFTDHRIRIVRGSAYPG